ncbi:TPA: restriction endonuclease subunit S [Vibrio cholerae]|uniref:restriction endonuclease subunit S n=1 Tax=Vibrio cholerae TaxID=666 RepID=UPI000E470D6F|nr:restriction endonuclease subunit S [Vibrio cholerae]TQQ45000.1 restriction endonuclease [Vibrio cholerae]
MSWSNVALSTLVDIKGGGTPSKANPEYWNGSIPWASVKDFKSSDLNGASDYITQEGIDNSATSLIPRGNLIVPTRMALGKIAINSVDIAINQDLKALIIKDESVVDTEYLFRCIQSKSEEIVRQGKGATVKGITVDVLKNLQIPLPPLETQKQIAAVLEKADQLRKDCQQMEQELNSLAQSVFIDMFGDPVTNPKGWEIVTIGDLLLSANYGTSEKASTEKKKYPVLRMNNITYEGNWDFSSLKYMDMSEDDEDKYLVESGDILFNRTNSKELVGKTAVYREATPMAYAGYLVRARCNELAHPEYISSFMNSRFTKKTLQSMCKSIVGMANINAKEFQKISVAKPPIELQQEFARRVEAIRAEVEATKQQGYEYDHLFNSLMQKAFKGELTL